MLFFLKKEFRISTNLFFFFLLQHEFTFKLCFNELSIQVLVLKASSATKYFFFLKCLKKMQHAVLTEIIQYFYKLLLYIYIYINYASCLIHVSASWHAWHLQILLKQWIKCWMSAEHNNKVILVEAREDLEIMSNYFYVNSIKHLKCKEQNHFADHEDIRSRRCHAHALLTRLRRTINHLCCSLNSDDIWKVRPSCV